jgi:hypothetical protein
VDPQPAETTLYSLSPAAPPDTDRRDGDRLMTLYRVGSLSLADRRELCLIKNISAGGMMVRVYCTIPEGTRLTVELKCGQSITGAVSWTRDVHLGISFDEPVDVLDILANPAARAPACQGSRSNASSRSAKGRSPTACAPATSARGD